MSSPSHLYRREIGVNISSHFVEYILQNLYRRETHFDHPLIYEVLLELRLIYKQSRRCQDIVYELYKDLDPEESSIVILGQRVGQKIGNWKLLHDCDEIKMYTN